MNLPSLISRAIGGRIRITTRRFSLVYSMLFLFECEELARSMNLGRCDIEDYDGWKEGYELYISSDFLYIFI
jgi:hypothetical protein